MTTSLLTYIALALGILALIIVVYSYVRQRGQMPHLRSVLIYLALAFVILAAIVWVLEAASLLKTSLSNPLSAAFTALSTILALIQLIPQIVRQTPPVNPTPPKDQILPEDLAYIEFIKDRERQIVPGTGTLVVRVGKDAIGKEVYIGGQRTYVGEHMASNGCTAYFATLGRLKPNNYMVRMGGRETWSPVNPDRVAQLDWR